MKLFRLVALAFAFIVLPVEVALANDRCSVPPIFFEFSYLDTMIKTTKEPSRDVFLSISSPAIGATRMQMHLWYVLQHPSLSSAFFQKVPINGLVRRNQSAINSILWIMSRVPGVFSKRFRRAHIKAFNLLEKWSENEKKNNLYHYTVMKYYGAMESNKMDALPAFPSGGIADPDLVVALGVQAEKSGKMVNAYGFYSYAAGFGYSNALVGAALLIPRIGGEGCLERASYYVRLAGALAPRTWWYVSKENTGTDEKRRPRQ